MDNSDVKDLSRLTPDLTEAYYHKDLDGFDLSYHDELELFDEIYVGDPDDLIPEDGIPF